MSRHHARSSGSKSGIRNASFLEYMSEFIGDTVTIFTTSGGASGFGFTGVILSVNSDYVRLMIEPGLAPVSPLADNVLAELESSGRTSSTTGRIGNIGRIHEGSSINPVGSVVDIPVDRITAFTHHAK